MEKTAQESLVPHLAMSCRWLDYRVFVRFLSKPSHAFTWNASRKLYVKTRDGLPKTLSTVPICSHPRRAVLPKTGFFSRSFTSPFYSFCTRHLYINWVKIPFKWANPPVHQGEMNILECAEFITKMIAFAIATPPWA